MGFFECEEGRGPSRPSSSGGRGRPPSHRTITFPKGASAEHREPQDEKEGKDAVALSRGAEGACSEGLPLWE